MSKHSRVQSNLEYLTTRLLLSGLGLLPRSVAVKAGLGMGHLAYRVSGGLKRTGRINLGLAYPELSEAERTRMLRGSFLNLGRLLGEFSQLPYATPESLRKFIVYDAPLERYKALKAEGRGVIFLTGHIGAWELLSIAHSVLEDPITIVVRPIDNPRIDRLVNDVRSKFGNKIIDKKNAARQSLRVLREGGTLGILGDINTLPNEGVFVPFFGRLACTTAGVATLALRTNAAVFPVCGAWDHVQQRFVIHGDPEIELVRTGNLVNDIELNTARFAKAIENLIRAYPDQWLWIHKRWRTQPEGMADPYSKSAQMVDPSKSSG
ncbi:MAG: lysophospholipid acyltransferase family protein [Candidatus Udaeobacter sp.]